MDYQEDPNYSNVWDQKPSRPHRSGMEMAAFIFSALSVLFMLFFPLTLVFIGLSILFALLSKGSNMKISQFAKLSILISVVSFTIGGFSTASSLYRNWDVFTQDFQKALDRAYDMLENPESYDEYNWFFDDSDSSTPDSYRDFYGNSPNDRNSDGYGNLIDDIYEDSPYYHMPTPVSPDSFSQPSSDIV